MKCPGFKIIILSLFFFSLIGFISLCNAGKTPVRIGGTVSLSGKYIETSKMIQIAYKLWAKQVNENGGLLGRPVKLILYDDKSEKNLVRTLYEKLVKEDKVDLILSPYGTPLTMVASEITERYGYTMMACAASGDAIWERGYKYVFGVYAMAGRYFTGFLDMMARNGLQSLGVLFENTSFNISVARGVKKWSDRFGLTIKLYHGFVDPEKELADLLQKIKANQIDGLVFSAYPPECYEFINLMKKAAYRPKALAFTIVPVHPDFYKRVGSFAEGVFGPSQWEPDERLPFPGTKKFIHDFETFTGRSPSYHAGSAYASCQVLEKAINYTNSFDQDKIRDFVRSLDTVTVIGRFKVDHTGRQIGHNPMIIQWQDKTKQIVYPPKMRTALPQFLK